jgi:hypothetical protein
MQMEKITVSRQVEILNPFPVLVAVLGEYAWARGWACIVSCVETVSKKALCVIDFFLWFSAVS